MTACHSDIWSESVWAVLSLSKSQILLGKVSNVTAFHFDNDLDHLPSVWLFISWPCQIRQRLFRLASCATDSIYSASADKPDWVLMSTTWGIVLSFVVMAFYWSLPPGNEAMLPRWSDTSWCYYRSQDWRTKKPNAWSKANLYRNRASLMSSLLLWLHKSLMSLPQAGISLPWIKDITAQ